VRIRYGTLKRIIREVGVSPSVFRNNQVLRDPLEKPTIAKAVAALEEPFRQGILMNLTLESRDSYDEQARDLDDQAYERIKEVAGKATEMMMSRVHKSVQGTWAEAMKGVQGAEKPAAPAKAVA
jgi:hypothetical protein